MADEARARGRELVEVAGLIARDAGRLAAQHGQLLRAEVRQSLGDSAAVAASIGAGAGLVAAGGVLGSLMLVHGLHRATRLPLWGCYGLVGGLATAAGVGLVAAGTRRATNLALVPRETLAALRDDLQWIADQAKTRTS